MTSSSGPKSSGATITAWAKAEPVNRAAKPRDTARLARVDMADSVTIEAAGNPRGHGTVPAAAWSATDLAGLGERDRRPAGDLHEAVECGHHHVPAMAMDDRAGRVSVTLAPAMGLGDEHPCIAETRDGLDGSEGAHAPKNGIHLLAEIERAVRIRGARPVGTITLRLCPAPAIGKVAAERPRCKAPC